MPISDDEWDAGETDTVEPSAQRGDYDVRKDLVVSFLGENVGEAFTREEIVRGVDFDAGGDVANPDSTLVDVGDRLVDAVGGIAASAIVRVGIDDALDDLVEEGIVERKEIETDDGTATYYRLADHADHDEYPYTV